MARLALGRRRLAAITFGLLASQACRSTKAETPHPHAAPKHEPVRASSAKPDAATRSPWLVLPPTPALPASRQSGLAVIGEAKIWYARFGEGPPVLLMHGGLGNSDYWGHQVVELMRTHEVVVMDTRGHGRSPFAGGRPSYQLFAEDAAGLLDHLKIPAASIVGWSDGAITGLQLAMKRPDRVTRLFAFGANISVDGIKPGGTRSPVFAAYVARCHVEYARLSPSPGHWGQLADGLDAMWRSEPNFSRAELAAITAPTIVSDGEHDEVIRREHTERIAREIGHARMLIQPGVSHFAMLQDPAGFNRAVSDFLADG